MPADLQVIEQAQRAHDSREELYALARRSPAVFAQLVLRDERTGGPVKLAPVHRTWHNLSSQHDRLVIWAQVELGKTSQMSIARTLWEIGKDPNLRVCILSNTHGQAAKLVRTIAQYVENSKPLKRVWPEMKPGTLWTQSSLTVKRDVWSKDPTIQATGVHGNILGSRIDLLIIDDILDYENCRTPDARQQLWEWLQSTVLGRLTEHARVVCIGTAFHPDDAMHRFAKSQRWKAVRYPAVDDDSSSPTFGQPRWPERWPNARIEAKRQELGSLEFARQMLCQARDDGTAVFRQEWINTCLQLGRDKEMAYALERVPQGCATYTGVDLAVQQHAAADLTVLTSIVALPSGRKEILWIEAGRWHGHDIVERIRDHHNRYKSMVMVENNSAQDFIAQYARREGIPTRGYTTGRNKIHPEFGVEHLAVEFETGQWIFPNKGGIQRELNALIGELLSYDPKGHTGDRIMSLWLAREAARLGLVKAERGYLNLLSR